MSNENFSSNLTFSSSLKSFTPNLVYLLLSLPIGILYFTAIVTGVSLGVGTSIIYIGVPILAFTLITAKGFMNFDKILASKLLNTNVCLPPVGSLQGSNTEGFIKKLLAIIKDPKNWASVLYCLVKLPIGIFNFTVAITLTTLSLGLLLSPVIYFFLKSIGSDFIMFGGDIFSLFGIYLPQSAKAGICFIIGLGISYLTVNLINSLAKNSARATLKML